MLVSPKCSYAEILMPNVMGVMKWGFWKVLRLLSGTLINWISVLIKRDPAEIPHSVYQWRTT